MSRQSCILRNARAPTALVANSPADLVVDTEGLILVDIEIAEGLVTAITPPSGGLEPGDRDLDGGQVWPCFADIPTHLDIGHIWTRAPNVDGSLWTAVTTVANDRDAHWSAADLRARMEFGLRSSYAHGTRAIRTHLQSPPNQAATSWVCSASCVMNGVTASICRASIF